MGRGRSLAVVRGIDLPGARSPSLWPADRSGSDGRRVATACKLWLRHAWTDPDTTALDSAIRRCRAIQRNSSQPLPRPRCLGVGLCSICWSAQAVVQLETLVGGQACFDLRTPRQGPIGEARSRGRVLIRSPMRSPPTRRRQRIDRGHRQNLVDVGQGHDAQRHAADCSRAGGGRPVRQVVMQNPELSVCRLCSSCPPSRRRSCVCASAKSLGRRGSSTRPERVPAR